MPVVSQAQRRWAYATEEGETSAAPSVGKDFVDASHGLKGLPEHVHNGRPAGGGGSSMAKPMIKKSRRGLLHKKLNVPQGEPIPASKIAAAEHSSSPSERKEARFADNLGHGGAIAKHFDDDGDDDASTASRSAARGLFRARRGK
jgi:hypothetical protein